MLEQITDKQKEINEHYSQAERLASDLCRFIDKTDHSRMIEITKEIFGATPKIRSHFNPYDGEMRVETNVMVKLGHEYFEGKRRLKIKDFEAYKAKQVEWKERVAKECELSSIYNLYVI